MPNLLIPMLWIVSGTALVVPAAGLLYLGFDQTEAWMILAAWPVLYVAGIAVLIGVVGAGVAIGRK